MGLSLRFLVTNFKMRIDNVIDMINIFWTFYLSLQMVPLNISSKEPTICPVG